MVLRLAGALAAATAVLDSAEVEATVGGIGGTGTRSATVAGTLLATAVTLRAGEVDNDSDATSRGWPIACDASV